MNRDIEYRGKVKGEDKWVFGYYKKSHASHFAWIESWFRERNGDHTWIAHSVIPETVGQYTGLKDKNGKKIFEGDIVLYKGMKLPVLWGNEKAGFFIGKDKYWMMNDCELEVIGNIHDNPELLEDAL